MTTPTMPPEVAEALRLHHLAADARVRLLNLQHAGIALSDAEINSKHDAENALAAHLLQMRETVRREALNSLEVRLAMALRHEVNLLYQVSSSPVAARLLDAADRRVIATPDPDLDAARKEQP